jgi:uroporphyrinogen decarboxylase
MGMTKRERLEATLCGEAVDRPAVALWRHWPGDDQRAADLARAHVAFQQRYDFDLMKVSPSSSYCLEDWGVVDRWVAGTDEGTREYLERPVHSPADWHRLAVLDPRQGALGRQLRCLELIAAEVGSGVPFIQTIFNPLSQAKNLAGDEQLLVHLRTCPDDLRAGLEIVTETTVRFVQEVLKTGAAGVFFAVQHGNHSLLCEEEYRHVGRPYDLRVLEAAQGGWFNLLHIHGNDIMFDALVDYPVQAVNWHDRDTWPSLAEALERCDKALVGGLRRHDTMLLGTPDDVRAEAADAIAQTRGHRFILGTGCVTPITSPTSHIHAARAAVEG